MTWAEGGPFPRVDGALRCGPFQVGELAKRFGTPLFVYSMDGVRDRFRSLVSAFRGVDLLVAYSVKANGNLALVNRLGAMGAGADIVSGGELFRALKAGISPGKIIFAGEDVTDLGLTERARRDNPRFERRIVWLDPETFVPLRTEHHKADSTLLVAETSQVKIVEGVPTPELPAELAATVRVLQREAGMLHLAYHGACEGVLRWLAEHRVDRIETPRTSLEEAFLGYYSRTTAVSPGQAPERPISGGGR